MFCVNCGNRLADNSIFCGGCGAKVDTVPDTAAVPGVNNTQTQPQTDIPAPLPANTEAASEEITHKQKAKKNRKLPVTIAALAAAVAIFAGVGLYMFFGSGDNGPDGQPIPAEIDGFAAEVPENNITRDHGGITSIGFVSEELYAFPLDMAYVIRSDYGWDYVGNQLIFFADSDATKAEIRTIAEGVGAEIVGYLGTVNFFQIKFPSTKSVTELRDIITELEMLPQIELAQLNFVFEQQPAAVEPFIPNDPWEWEEVETTWDVSNPSDQNWGVEKIRAPYAWAYHDSMQAVNVGVIDTMIDYSHKDLIGRGRDVRHPDPGRTPDMHGTHVAGTIGAGFNNGIGITGVAPNAELLGWAIDLNLEFDVFHMMFIIHFLVHWNDAQIINYSMQFDYPLVFGASRGNENALDFISENAELMAEYLGALLSQGYNFVIVTAAGNTNDRIFVERRLRTYGYIGVEGGVFGLGHWGTRHSGNVCAFYGSLFNAIEDPTVRNHIIVVGSIGDAESNFAESDFSNRNPDIFAPGERIVSTVPYNSYADLPDEHIVSSAPNNSYVHLPGTSMAAPHVSGVAAMIFGINPDLTGAAVRDIILSTAHMSPWVTPVTEEIEVTWPPLRNPNVLNAEAAVRAALDTLDTEPCDEKDDAARVRGAATTIAVGVGASYAIQHDGSLWAWGWNDRGRLGDGTTTDRHDPVWIMDDVLAVATGNGGHTMAIRSDGSLWAWGRNDFGQLGDGTTTDRHSPVLIMDDVIAVACGAQHTMAIRSDGNLWAWGENYFYGQLGDGTTTNRHSPVRIMDDVVAVACGEWHTMAIRSDGSLWAWGINFSGQLGDGTMIDRHSPVWIMDDVIAVACDGDHTMAIRSDGSLWAWGLNDDGRLGDGTTTDLHSPVQIMDDVIAVACGSVRTMVIRSDGNLWAWGGNSSGWLGDGTTTERHSPVLIMDDVIAVAAGGHHAMAIRSDGSLWAWGWNHRGQLGDGTTTDRHAPVWIMDDVMR